MEALKAVMERLGAELCVAHLHWWAPKRLALRLLLPVHLLPSHIFSSQRKRQSRNGECCSGGLRAAARRSGSGLNPWNGTVVTLWWDGWSLFCLSCFFPAWWFTLSPCGGSIWWPGGSPAGWGPSDRPTCWGSSGSSDSWCSVLPWVDLENKF